MDSRKREFLEKLDENFIISETDVKNRKRGISMYLGGKWYN